MAAPTQFPGDVFGNVFRPSLGNAEEGSGLIQRRNSPPNATIQRKGLSETTEALFAFEALCEIGVINIDQRLAPGNGRMPDHRVAHRMYR
jgi:hypothetical protein